MEEVGSYITVFLLHSRDLSGTSHFSGSIASGARGHMSLIGARVGGGVDSNAKSWGQEMKVMKLVVGQLLDALRPSGGLAEAGLPAVLRQLSINQVAYPPHGRRKPVLA